MSRAAPPSGSALDDPEFSAERPRLVGVAYRITGSRTEADDIVQDAWLRWQRADRAAIDRPAAWLTTVVSRIALDRLKSAHHQREAYVGPWLPETANPEPGPAERAELAESLTLGFLAVLERLSPTERVVFLLVDVFGTPFAEVAEVVAKTPEACRQIASRARRRVREERPRFDPPSEDEAWQVTLAFMAAAQAGDLDALTSLLAADAVLISDGGADHHAARRPVIAERIPRFIVNLTRRLFADLASVELEGRLVNGEPGLVIRQQGTPMMAMAIEVRDGKVQGICNILNPEKLTTLDSEPVT
ncbi:MAG: polymerase, sigma-24 subunit, subfamily [Acidimicrobiales bacterium]|nr:polymerase, sigma-24 subunit, subfamily [Acidimicrobiales bacterium]